jgi:hypothetical protein
MNTSTQFMSVNITFPDQEQFLPTQQRHVDTNIVNVILQKDTRGSFHQWMVILNLMVMSDHSPESI